MNESRRFARFALPRGEARSRGLIVVCGVIVLAGALCLLCTFSPARVVSGAPRVAATERLSQDPNFPNVDPVSGTPANWIAAVCAPDIRQVSIGSSQFFATIRLAKNTMFHVPGSAYSAVCRAREASASDPFILLAQYQSENAMERELKENDIRWYSFAGRGGQLLVIATRSDEAFSGSQGLAVSKVLEALTSYGFATYGDPEP